MGAERSLSRLDAAFSLSLRDHGLLIGYCCALFGISLIGGRPLTLHESVLPQSAREMLADGDWIVPKKGGEPWLESPPLPQWCTVAIATVIGRCDAEWIVRIGPALVATLTVWLTAWMATVWYGRTIGVLSGLMLATACQFLRYAWLAEDEIYLCGLVTATIAWFVRLEFVERESDAAPGLYRVFLGTRPWPVVLFFILLGCTNLAKGLIFGTAMAVIPLIGWLGWNRDWQRASKYLWVWGWAIYGLLLVAWPLASMWREPSVADVWWYDLGGRLTGEYTEINQPLWYYVASLPWMIAPWTLLVPFGIAATWQAARSERNSPARFLWAWAVLVPLVFSIPGGKHHHYLLHALAPWTILAALGAEGFRRWLATWPRWVVHPAVGVLTLGVPLMIGLTILSHRDLLPGPRGTYLVLMTVIPIAAFCLTWGLHHGQGKVVAATAFSTILICAAAGHWYAGQYFDTHRFDVALLRRTRSMLENSSATVVVDLSRSPLSGFLELFYLPDNARSIHNISFLNDESLPNELLLLTPAGNVAGLEQLGAVSQLDRSERPLKADKESSRLTLLAVKLRDDLPRQSTAELSISPMQAMQRAEGPVLR